MVKQVPVVENILSANDQIAAEITRKLDAAGVLGINIMASPGAGKTSLIEKTVIALIDEMKIAVIDGDIATTLDADRAEAAGAVSIQITTHGSCHLEAHWVRDAIMQLDLRAIDLLIIENVGNLVCPSGWQLGMHHQVLVASIPEGDDKPYKYPIMYRGVDTLVVNKIDLAPYIKFDMDYFTKGVEILNPGLRTFPLSCTTDEGMAVWLDWLRKTVAAFKRV